MRIAVCSDEPYEIHYLVVQKLTDWGHEVVPFGSIASGQEESWALVARLAAEAVAFGDCEEGVFFCWSGTGISMAANKVPGIRCALCMDSETARLARIWNHANVLALSNRLATAEVVVDILESWFATSPNNRKGLKGVSELLQVVACYQRERP